MKNPLHFSIKLNWRHLTYINLGSIPLAILLLGFTAINQWGALTLFKFYYSLIFNVLMFTIIIVYISFVTFILEQLFPRKITTSSRFLLQCFLGIFGAIFFAYLLAICYFKIGRIAFPHEFYFGTLFQIIVVLILCGNIYFTFWPDLIPLYGLKDKQEPIEAKAEVSEIATTAFFQIPANAAAIYSSDSGTRCITFELTELRWSQTLESLIPLLNPEDYLVVRRGLILNRNVIDRIRRVLGKRKWEMVLKPGYAALVKTSLAIPRENVTNAKEWLNRT